VIVMTSNLGSHEIQRLSADPSTNVPELIKEAVMGEVRKQFRPEFINRIDEVVVFHALDTKNIAAIAKIQLQDLEARLKQRDITLTISDAALIEIAKAGFDPLYGARPLRRAIQSQIENPLAKLMLKGRYGEKDVIPVDFVDGQFSFERTVH
jgi:ATP-dependent Clp protease ATP-binding subunit ClpB